MISCRRNPSKETMRPPEALHLLPAFLLLMTSAAGAAQAAAPAPAPAPDTYADVLAYIEGAWDTLTRSLDSCDTVVDPKMPDAAVLYLPANYDPGDRLRELQS